MLHELKSSCFLWSFSTCYAGSKRHVIFQILPAISLRFLGTFELHAKVASVFCVCVVKSRVHFLWFSVFFCIFVTFIVALFIFVHFVVFWSSKSTV